MTSLTSPPKIQEFLDQTSYSTEDLYRCPLRVLRERKAHCFDGAVFAAAALRGTSGFHLWSLSSFPIKGMTTT